MKLKRHLHRLLVVAATLLLGLSVTAAPAHAVTLRFLYNVDFAVSNVNNVQIHGGTNDAFKALHRCFNCSFPVEGGPLRYPTDGQHLPLQVCTIPGLPCLNANVYSYDHERSGYLFFVAGPGHFDGEGSTVQFTFYRDSGGYLHLNVIAYVANSSVPDPANILAATNTWANFARQLGNFMYQYGCPYGSCPAGTQFGCSGYSCDNQDPNLSWTLGDPNYPGVPCSADANNVGVAIPALNGALQLRWGPHCSVNWARFTPYGSGTWYLLSVSRQSPAYTTTWFQFQSSANVAYWSNQVYAPGPARACVERWNGSSWSSTVCTPWY